MKEIKHFQAESKELLNLVINSIYSNKDVFLRELISNASDAIDKYKYKSLTEKGLDKRDHKIIIKVDEKKKVLSIIDNGIGMSKEDLVDDLGTIAKSGSKEFFAQLEKVKADKSGLNIIGQFGVGFYSAYMVAKNIVVTTKKYDDKAYRFESDGLESYSIEELSDETDGGTRIDIYLKDDVDEEDYSRYLKTYVIEDLVKKYSDYIRYPIQMDVKERVNKKDENGEDIKDEFEENVVTKTLNSMIPLWKKNKKEVSDKDLSEFYKEHFYDYEDPISSLNIKVEGLVCYNALAFIPSHIPSDLYSENYEKGLDLYAKSVFIQKNCKDLIPDYLKFVKGLVDSDDLSLNVSREMLQNDVMLKRIRESIEKKILSNLKDLKKNDNEKYLKFFDVYGTFLKYGIYSSFGSKKEELQDLLIYDHLNGDDKIDLKSYVGSMESSQEKIYFACGKSLESIKLLPQLDIYRKKGIDVLLLKDSIDEFSLTMMRDYEKKQFFNIASEKEEDVTQEEKDKISSLVAENKEIVDIIKDSLSDKVSEVTFTNDLIDAPACIQTKNGGVSMNMEEVLDNDPNMQGKIKSEKILKINSNSRLFELIKSLKGDDESIKKAGRVLYDEAMMLQGFEIKDKAEFVNNINDLISKSLSIK